MVLSNPNRTLLAMAILNLVLAITVATLGPASIGFAYTVTMSKYRELENNGVVDHAKLEQVWGAKSANNWGESVDHLVGEQMRSLLRGYYYISAAFLLNAVVLFALWRTSGRSITTGDEG